MSVLVVLLFLVLPAIFSGFMPFLLVRFLYSFRCLIQRIEQKGNCFFIWFFLFGLEFTGEGMAAIPMIKRCLLERPDFNVLMTTTTLSALWVANLLYGGLFYRSICYKCTCFFYFFYQKLVEFRGYNEMRQKYKICECESDEID